MKFFASVVTVVFVLNLTGALYADEGMNKIPQTGFYLSFSPFTAGPFSVDTTSPDLSPATLRTQWGSGIDAGLGYRYGDFRIEGDILYSRSDGNNIRFPEGGGDITGCYEMWGATVNFFYDIPTGTRLRPYLGTGLGGVRFEAQDITLADFPPTTGSNTLFTYKLMAGVSYALTDVYHVLLGYRFMGMSEQDYETGGIPLHGDSIQTHALQIGIQFYF